MARARESRASKLLGALFILATISSPLHTCLCEEDQPTRDSLRSPTCEGRRVYTHKLPPKFNTELRYSDEVAARVNQEWFAPYMLSHLQRACTNDGFGSKIEGEVTFGQDPKLLEDLQGVWYETDQNSLEVIFQARMSSYDCLVEEYGQADLVYVPYFGGFDSLHNMHRDKRRRDNLAVELLQLLQFHPAWQRLNGSDHFWVLGRNIWDFFRQGENTWGSKLLAMPEVRHNVWTILAETCVGETRVISAPKPTAFHPKTKAQLEQWQALVKAQERKTLFSYAGGARDPSTDAGMMREKISWQCRNSDSCSTISCIFDSNRTKCDDVSNFFQLYLSSTFCLHPTGDACSRRSVLDGMLAGCIPVVFRSCTLQDQFQWHFQKYASQEGPFFVYIPAEKLRGPPKPAGSSDSGDLGEEDLVLIEDELKKLSQEEVEAMRRRVIDLIPSFTYGGLPNGNGTYVAPDFRDAVDLIIDGLIESAVLQQTRDTD